MLKECGCTLHMECVKCQKVIYEWADSEEESLENNMGLIEKIEAIVEFSTSSVSINSGLHDEFFEYNDLGIPLSIALNEELATINEKGIKVIDETFKNLCLTMGIDPEKNYRDYDDMLEEAANEDED